VAAREMFPTNRMDSGITFHIPLTAVFFSNTKQLDQAQKSGNPGDLFQYFTFKAILNLKMLLLH
jgi:hypothetical protein